MPDPFKPVNPSDPFQVTAVAWNAMLLAGKQARARQLDEAATTSSLTPQATIVRVKNESGDDQPRNSVLGLDGPLFTPSDSEDAFLRRVTFKGVVPDDTNHVRRYAVLLDPALDGHFARAYLAGVCQVRVNILHEAHRYAAIDTGHTDRLKSTWHGHARILWREDEDAGYGGYAGGEQWAIVMLGVTGSCVAVGKAHAGGITARSGTTYGSGSVDLYRSDGGNEDGPIETIDVLNACGDTSPSGAIAAGKYVAVAWDHDGRAWVSPLEC